MQGLSKTVTPLYTSIRPVFRQITSIPPTSSLFIRRDCLWRKVWDSNPRMLITLLVFKTNAINQARPTFQTNNKAQKNKIKLFLIPKNQRFIFIYICCMSLWQKGRDSNPRRRISPQQISNLPHSTSLPPFYIGALSPKEIVE